MELRAVLPVAHQLKDGGWLTSIEIYEDGLALRLTAPFSSGSDEAERVSLAQLSWSISDDCGTDYAFESGGGGDSGHGVYISRAAFKPAPPLVAAELYLSGELSDDIAVPLVGS